MPSSMRFLHALRRRTLQLGCAVLALSCEAVAAAEPLPVYMLEAPPLTMSGPPGENGILGDAALLAGALADQPLALQSLPWNRAQRMVQQGQDLLIIPLSRTPERESKYTWIAPVMTMERAFFSLSKQVGSFAEARQTYQRIAVGMGSAQEQKLREEGFSDEQIYPLKIGENPAQMLLLGRVDAWFNGVPETQYIWKGVSSKPLLMSPPLMSADLYLACSAQCSEARVHSLRQAVETLRRNGTLNRLIHHYLYGLPSDSSVP
ncbi:transporter substrate-binding domain-containing protein [Pseudomonas sp. DTU_2021_1001937_2_SI_NGA_ILE_001]|uniref:substrate-binding periplasmic protein n=1 Tax=Pseudomonas sp. DTU_2021_1001937_2_SI_NGA_ILE_001 TaxID=3077589 RepID=UPI0028FC2E51|nr:transporter substrate-binding domain-containing protein [Pseudomonas sp. DTU_2021_1001937_2_SI_NGA_ILE_001]